MKDCLISFSSHGRENYNKGLLRLIDSALVHWKGDILVYSPDHWLTEYRGIIIHKGLPDPVGIESYSHKDMPYQFKVALIQKARELGYERVVWLDSSFVLNKDITPLFGPSGIGVFHNLGHDLYRYISDEAFHKTGVYSEDLKRMKQIWGGALFFDFRKPNAVEVFELIKKFSLNGSFRDGGSVREGFVAHRHDQAVISVLVHDRCEMYAYGKVVCPPHDKTLEYGDDIYLICRPNE